MKNWVESKLKGLDELSDIEMDIDPCQEGYEQIGMKEKDGRLVPNCVPKKWKTTETIQAEQVLERAEEGVFVEMELTVENAVKEIW